MTLLMRDRENQKIGEKRGEKRGEEKMFLLMERLIEDGCFDDIARMKTDIEHRHKLYVKYHII